VVSEKPIGAVITKIQDVATEAAGEEVCVVYSRAHH
jgi:hypothetical protein